MEAANCAWQISPTKLERVKEETRKDADLKSVKHYMSSGWRRYVAVIPQAVKPYYNARQTLSVSHNLVVCGYRILIPKSMRADILEKFHSGH